MSVKSPSEHENLFDSSYKRFSIILEELTNSYPLYKLNPTYSKFYNEYKKQCTQLKTVKDAIFLYKNNLQKDSVTLKDNVKDINAKITLLNDENKNLTDKLNNLQESDYAAGGELFFHLSRMKKFPEHMTRFYAAEIAATELLYLQRFQTRSPPPNRQGATGAARPLPPLLDHAIALRPLTTHYELGDTPHSHSETSSHQ